MVWLPNTDLSAADLNLYLPQAYSSWTPTVTAQTGTFTAVTGAGRFVQFGNKLVVWQATFTITTPGTGTDGLVFTLPVNSAAQNRMLGVGRENQVTGVMLQVSTFGTSVTQGLVVRYDNATAIGSGRIFVCGGTYEGA